MAELVAGGPALVHFFDFAQLNSVRALPYLLAWRRRYGGAGLAVVGIHSPRFPFSAERAKLASAVERLGIEHPVAEDSSYRLWRAYGCRGWPSLFLWGRGGALRWAHFGEGEYLATEEAIQEELRALHPERELPEPMAPLRPTDAPDAGVVPPSEEVFPGGSASEARPAAAGPLDLEYAAGGAHASVDGEGELTVSVDAGGERRIPVGAAGLYTLAEHPRHERHRLRLSASHGLLLYSVSFSAGVR